MLPEEVTKLIGKAGEVRVFQVEKGAIERFADASDDQNPLYYDEEYAKNSRYGSIIAPPGFVSSHWFTRAVSNWKIQKEPSTNLAAELVNALEKAGYTNPGLVDTGMEYDFFTPTRVGDTITAIPRIKDLTERTGKSGKMVFFIIEITYTNQNGDLVAKSRAITIKR